MVPLLNMPIDLYDFGLICCEAKKHPANFQTRDTY